MNLQEKIQQDSQKVLEVLKADRSLYELGDNYVRVLLGKNTDSNDTRNVPTLVLNHNYVTELDPQGIVDLLYERSLLLNQSIGLDMTTINAFAPRLKDGETVFNKDIVSAVSSFDSSLNTLKRKVLESHLVDWLTISSILESKGFNRRDLEGMKTATISLAQSAILANTDEEGRHPFGSTNHVVDHMLSKQGIKKILETSPEKKSWLVDFHSMNKKYPTKDITSEFAV